MVISSMDPLVLLLVFTCKIDKIKGYIKNLTFLSLIFCKDLSNVAYLYCKLLFYDDIFTPPLLSCNDVYKTDKTFNSIIIRLDLTTSFFD